MRDKWASPDPFGPAVLARSVRGSIHTIPMFTAYFDAVNLPDWRCLHPCYQGCCIGHGYGREVPQAWKAVIMLLASGG